MATFLGHLENVATISEACRLAGITRSCYEKWRSRSPSFRAQADAVRLGNPQVADLGFQGDFISFRKTFFGYDTYWHQREIVRAIETAKPGQIVLINVPPEHGKTTLLEDYANYKLAIKPDFRITLVSEGLGHSRKILGRVANRMVDPRIAPQYIEQFGPFKLPNNRKPWSADFFKVWKATSDERDYSMEARGWKSAIAGTRTDLLLIDDIQSVRSLNMTSKMIEAFRQDMLTRPGRDGICIIVGTRVGIDDFYDRCVEEGIIDKHICLPAMRDGESLCPEMWPTEVLELRRQKVGEEVWWRNYMQSPRASMDATFTDKMIDDAWSMTRHLGQSTLDPEKSSKVAGLDPALAGGNAIHVAAYDAENFQVLDIDHGRNLARVEEILSRLEKMAAKHRFEDLVVETNAYQKGLAEDDRLKWLAREYGFRIHVHQTGTNKTDQAIGVARMPISFIEGRISLPGGDEHDREKLDILVSQLRTWRADVPTRKLVQDQVMAMWFCWLFWQKRRSTFGGKTWRRSGLPFAATNATGWRINRGLMLTGNGRP